MTIIIAAAILSGLILSPLGCIVLWKKYVYFGDGLAHSALLVGVISAYSGMPIFYAAIVNSLIFILAIIKLKHKSGNNATIAMVSSIMIALAIVVSNLFPSQINIYSILFGDILAVNMNDIKILLILLLIVILYLIVTHRQIIFISLSADIAISRNIKARLIEFSFLFILSFAILVTIKIAGTFLVTSILLIPAMIARIWSNSPGAMMIKASICSLIMSISGVLVSFYCDLPFASIIVLSGGVLYIISTVVAKYISCKK